MAVSEPDEGESEDLADEPEVRQASLQEFDPDDLGEVDVVQRHELVQVPELVGAEEVPVRAAQEGSEHDQHAPQHEEAHQEDRHDRGQAAEQPQAGLDRLGDPAARTAHAVPVGADGQSELGGQHHVVAVELVDEGLPHRGGLGDAVDEEGGHGRRPYRSLGAPSTIGK